MAGIQVLVGKQEVQNVGRKEDKSLGTGAAEDNPEEPGEEVEAVAEAAEENPVPVPVPLETCSVARMSAN